MAFYALSGRCSRISSLLAYCFRYVLCICISYRVVFWRLCPSLFLLVHRVAGALTLPQNSSGQSAPAKTLSFCLRRIFLTIRSVFWLLRLFLFLLGLTFAVPFCFQRHVVISFLFLFKHLPANMGQPAPRGVFVLLLFLHAIPQYLMCKFPFSLSQSITCLYPIPPLSHGFMMYSYCFG